MCGIVGSINHPLSNKTVQLTHHRGPDEFGAKKLKVSGHSVEFYHHRLSIVDLSKNGSQPMPSFDYRGLIVFNGEIYNHGDLRKEMKGIQFRGHSDTETLVNLCRQGCTTEALARLNGIFGFAYIDLQHNKFYLARDRYGVKPVYYFFDGRRVIFSSELRSITSEIQKEFSVGALVTSLKFRYVPAPATLYKNIYKVEPGQMITIDLGEKLTLSTSSFADLKKIPVRTNETMKKLVVEYGQLLERAVERQLMSDVEVGIFLSGGVDSCLIAAIAKSKGNNIKAFTVGFDDPKLDERSNAAKTASYLGLEHFTEKVTFGNFLTEFENIANIVEEPVDTGSVFSMYTLARLAAAKVKVVLSGQGADEPLAGYTKYKALPTIDLISKTRISPALLRLCSGLIRHRNLRRILSCAGKRNDLNAYFEFNSLFGEKDLFGLMNREEAIHTVASFRSSLNDFHDVLKKRGHLPKQRSSLFPYLDTRTKLPETLLNYTDKITMHFALECRVPMLDNDLVDFIESLPRNYKYNSRQGKIIHKQFAQDYLPAEMIHRKKLAFHAPSSAYLRNGAEEIKSFVRLYDNPFFWNVFDQQKVLQMLDEHARNGKMEKELILIISALFLTEQKMNRKMFDPTRPRKTPVGY